LDLLAPNTSERVISVGGGHYPSITAAVLGSRGRPAAARSCQETACRSACLAVHMRASCPS